MPVIKRSKHSALAVRFLRAEKNNFRDRNRRNGCFKLSVDINYRFLLWIIASIACAYQVTLRLWEFRSYPVILDLEMRRSNSIVFPSITLCSGILLNQLKVEWDYWNSHRDCFENTANCSQFDEKWTTEFLKDLPVTLEYYWSRASIQPENLMLGTPCPAFSKARNECATRKIEEVVEIQHMNTLWGRCLVLTLNYTMDYQGSFTWITINWKSPVLDKYLAWYPATDIYLFPHQSGLLLTHDTPFKALSVQSGYETTVRITSREFHVANTWKKPCISAEEAVKCRNSCVDKIFENNLPCRLPFINSTILPNCRNFNDIFKAVQISDRLYNELGSGDCMCTRPCEDVEYKTNLDDQKRNKNGTTSIRLMYPQSVTEVFVEKPVYSVSSLFSEIGGSIGLYLGLSVIKVINLVELLLNRFVYVRHP